MTGKVVKNGKLTQPLNEIDVSQYQEGIYFIRILNDDKYKNYKVIIH
jgi:hypothetical protein